MSKRQAFDYTNPCSLASGACDCLSARVARQLPSTALGLGIRRTSAISAVGREVLCWLEDHGYAYARRPSEDEPHIWYLTQAGKAWLSAHAASAAA